MAKEIYQVESLNDVINYYKQGFELPDGCCVSAEHYVDVNRNALVLKFIVDDEVDIDIIKARPTP